MTCARWLVASLSLLLVGCGVASGAKDAAPPAAEPAKTYEAAPRSEDSGAPENTVDEAALAFERAERELDDLVALAEVRPAAEAGDFAGADDAERAATAPAPRVTPNQQAPTRLRAAPACERACRALASMTRSSDRLCELTGEEDPRCENVKLRLSRARDAVRRSCDDCAH